MLLLTSHDTSFISLKMPLDFNVFFKLQMDEGKRKQIKKECCVGNKCFYIISFNDIYKIKKISSDFPCTQLQAFFVLNNADWFLNTRNFHLPFKNSPDIENQFSFMKILTICLIFLMMHTCLTFGWCSSFKSRFLASKSFQHMERALLHSLSIFKPKFNISKDSEHEYKFGYNFQF